MKALIVTGRGAQDQELIYPYYRLQEAEYEVDVATCDGRAFETYGGLKFNPSRTFGEIRADAYNLLVIPGGVKSMEHMRLDAQLVQFVADFHAVGKVVAAICSGAMLLISAGLVKGRRIACYPAWRVDVENAGGEFVDMPAVADDRIVTSTHYRHVGPWMSATLTTVRSYT